MEALVAGTKKHGVRPRPLARARGADVMWLCKKKEMDGGIALCTRPIHDHDDKSAARWVGCRGLR